MDFFKKFRSRLPKEKTKQELDDHFEQVELEKGDLLAMIIAAFLTFAPIIFAVTLIVFLVSLFFGL